MDFESRIAYLQIIFNPQSKIRNPQQKASRTHGLRGCREWTAVPTETVGTRGITNDEFLLRQQAAALHKNRSQISRTLKNDHKKGHAFSHALFWFLPWVCRLSSGLTR